MFFQANTVLVAQTSGDTWKLPRRESLPEDVEGGGCTCSHNFCKKKTDEVVIPSTWQQLDLQARSFLNVILRQDHQPLLLIMNICNTQHLQVGYQYFFELLRDKEVRTDYLTLSHLHYGNLPEGQVAITGIEEVLWLPGLFGQRPADSNFLMV